MDSISISDLYLQMFEIFHQLEVSGNELIVTDQEKSILKIIPLKPKYSVNEIFAGLQGQVTYLEDINTPSLPEWGEAK